jgi:hypothetical protein
MEFARLTRGRLSVFSASLHLEFTTIDEFAAKAEWFTLMLDENVKFVVNQVVLPDREADAERGRDAIEARGLRWFAQLYKHDGGVHEYPADTLVQLIGTRPANRAPSYRGRTCWAGVDYFTVDKDGNAWSCRTAKRFDEGSLGNLFDGTLRRKITPLACSYDICPCTVPANRGMIEGVAAAEDLE